MVHQSVWTPGADVTRHAGSLIPPNRDFFVAPPLEIGQVTSAESTLKTSTQPVSTPFRIIICLLVGLLGVGITWLITASAIFTGIIGSLFVLCAYGKTLFLHYCSYVGENGIAIYTLKGDRQNIAKAKVLRFQDATNLYTSQTQHYHNFFYNGTSYSYRFKQKSGQPFELGGSYRSRRGWPKDKDAWHLANTAELAWSNYLLPLVDEQLERLGYIEFPMEGYLQAVRVGPAFMEFVMKDGVVQRVQVADMKSITLGSGMFHFVHKDAQWWSGKGSYSFDYGNIPNAKLFLLCLKRLTGIAWN